ncbi:MAG: hypothetical protein ACJAVT_002081 [Yoonia sp.]
MYLRVGEVCDVRCPLIKGGVRALRIVKSNPVIDDSFRLETGNDSYRLKASSEAAKKTRKETMPLTKR